MTQTALSFSVDDKSNRSRVLSLLRSPANTWRSTLELQAVGGTRAPARVHELRRQGYVIECDGERGRFRYRLTGFVEPPPHHVEVPAPSGRMSWKRRALAAEAELALLKKQMEGTCTRG